MLPILVSILLIITTVAGVALIYRCLGMLVLNIGCGLLARTTPFQPERSLLQGALGLLLLCGVIALRAQLLLLR